jgi:lysyl-tRNA synthetase class 2
MSDSRSEENKSITEARRDKLERIYSLGIDPYPTNFSRSHSNRAAVNLFQQAESKNATASSVEDTFQLAGRITAQRNMGKASFLDINDGTERVQIFCKKDQLGDAYTLLECLDIGDFIGVDGVLFRTRTGEITIKATQITILCKALRGLPEKWHGFQDTEKRYRQRYLDLATNKNIKTVFQTRSNVISQIRRFMDQEGFLEVETPILVPVAAGAMARPFSTHHNSLDQDLYLRIATELYLKRLIVGGFEKVYEIGRVFRNEGIDADHNPEFTLLESYQAYADYNDVMAMVENLVSTVSTEISGSNQVTWANHTILLAPPWNKLPLKEAIYQFSQINIDDYQDPKQLANEMNKIGIEAKYSESRGRLIDKIVSSKVEPNLVQPTFLIDYPVEMSPLAKSKPEDPTLTERFEAFICGMEIANSFTELNDPLVQRKRFVEQEALRTHYKMEDHDRLDEDFLIALEHGMPPTGGLGIGIDRLIMLFTNQQTIREVVLFPQLRKIDHL